MFVVGAPPTIEVVLTGSLTVGVIKISCNDLLVVAEDLNSWSVVVARTETVVVAFEENEVVSSEDIEDYANP